MDSFIITLENIVIGLEPNTEYGFGYRDAVKDILKLTKKEEDK